MDAHVLAIDIGTTFVKAGVLGVTGQQHGLGIEPHPVLSPRSGWSEHNPADTWRATVRAIRSAIAASEPQHANIGAIAVTGPRGTIGLLDGDGVPLTNMLTWQDKRSTSLMDLAESAIDPAVYYDVTGTPLDPSTALLRLLWLRRNRHGEWSRARCLATPQGLVLQQLGAADWWADSSAAAMIGLLDVATRGWSRKLLDAFAIPEALLPALAPPGTIVGRLAGTVARDIGVAPGIPLVLAAADGPCGELGSGVTATNDAYAYLGTGLAVSAPLAARKMDPERRLIVMPGSLPDNWRVLALGLTGGSSLEWFTSIAGQSGYDQLEHMISRSPPGANGVAFLPALSGEGAPFWNPRTRAAFVGLSLATSTDDMARAVLEGVAVELLLMVNALGAFGSTPSELHLAGGGSRSRSWCLIVANAAGLPVNRVVDPHPSLRGAACYGFASRGDFGSAVDASQVLASPLETLDPDLGLHQQYSDAAELQLLLRDRLGDETILRRLSPSPDDA